MKGAALILLMSALVSCGNGGPQINNDALMDVGGDATGDIVAPTDAIMPDIVADLVPDMISDVAPDAVDEQCEDTLRSWMCRIDKCPADNFCAGYLASCAEPPCWGSACDFIPGFCLPSMTDGICSKTADCGAGYTCAKGLFSTRGICTHIGMDGLCLTNADCGALETCAGEVLNHVGSPGQGPGLPGVCLDVVTKGCWDDGMCVAGWCDGATLCAPGDGTCSPAPGQCVTGAVPACEPTDGGNSECSGSEWGNWCVGAEGFGNRWCAPPPAGVVADGQCWEDRDCSPALTGSLCRSAVTCPPRSYCRVAGFHSGVCGAAPAAGEGLTLKFADQTATGEVTLSQSSLVMLVNRGPVAIYLLPCGTVPVYAQKDGAWDGTTLSWGFSTAECASFDPGSPPSVILRLAPGSGMVLSITPGDFYDGGLAGRRIRLGLDYWLGCEPGGALDSDMDCLEVSNGLGRRMFSPDVLWKTAG